MKTWTDPNAPGWTLTLDDESTWEWCLALSISRMPLPTRWLVSTRRSPVVVWMGSSPVYVWTEGHDAHVATLMTPVVFRGVFGGASHENTPEVRRCECGAEKTYGVGCSGALHARWCPMFVFTRSEG